MSFPVDNIRRGCKAKGITLAELERKLGYGNGVIARWETAKTSPPVDRLIAISEELEIPMSELCRADEKPASVSADGLDAIDQLSPALVEELSRFVRLAKANPERALRFLAFANQEIESQF